MDLQHHLGKHSRRSSEWVGGACRYEEGGAPGIHSLVAGKKEVKQVIVAIGELKVF